MIVRFLEPWNAKVLQTVVVFLFVVPFHETTTNCWRCCFLLLSAAADACCAGNFHVDGEFPPQSSFSTSDLDILLTGHHSNERLALKFPVKAAKMTSTMVLLLLLFLQDVTSFLSTAHHNRRHYITSMAVTDYPELERCIEREYASFFQPMDKKFYTDNVEFIDPMTSFRGVNKYQGNVDMLAGRTGVGKIMFKDASIALHNVEQLDVGKLQTRWTLQVTVKAFPWQPRARFTGVSIYTLDSNGKVAKQEDYWDSVNLVKGQYTTKNIAEGLKDFAAQLRQEAGAEMGAPELPYELLRRAARYEVRRYPATVVAETTYDQRPEGYDRLGSYAGTVGHLPALDPTKAKENM